jgi:hypothetical protein
MKSTFVKFVIGLALAFIVGGLAAMPTFADQKTTRAAAADRKEETVYITKTGKKYHRATCGHLRQSKIPVTRGQAQAMGLTPCKTCHPDD